MTQNKLMTGLASAALALAASGAWAKDDITVALQLEPPHLDPTSAAAGAIDSVLYSNVFEGLTRFMGDGSVVPGLAESWEISEDGLTYTFKLREGVTFHDGTTMDAEDVKFTLDRINAEDSANAQKALYSAISEVNVIDPQTVEIKLSEPNGNMLFNLAWGDAVIVAPESIEVLVHPQSLIHALVGFCDGGLMAHVGPADMRHAIGYALHHPARGHVPVERLDLARIGQLDFSAPDDARWPALRLAREVMAAGGLVGAVFNAAKEVALDGFIDGRLRFTQMAEIVEEVLETRAEEAARGRDGMTLDLVAEADHLARKAAVAAITKRAG